MLHKSSFQRFLRFRRIRVPGIDVAACNLAHLRRQFRRCGRLRAVQNAVEGRVHQHLGALVVEYKYDAWGKLLSTTGSLADTLGVRNPFRYRGYVFDEESKLYYNLMRYYSSDLGRVISPDLYFTPSESIDTLADKNYFAYTDNNPIMRTNEEGLFWDTILDIVSVVGSIAEVIAKPADPIAWIRARSHY